LQQQRGVSPQQPGFTGRSANPGLEQDPQRFNGGNAGLPSGAQRGMREPGGFGSGAEQRGMREPGGARPGLEQQGRFGASPGGPGAIAPRDRGAMGPPSGQGRQLYNRAPAGPMSGPQPGAGQRGPGGAGGAAGGPGSPGGAGGPGGAGPALRGGDQQRGFERGR
jgi:hypothetical protein